MSCLMRTFCYMCTCSLTKLHLVNPSKANHYFTALEFADKVYTVLVLVGDPEVEVKGKVQVGGRLSLQGERGKVWWVGDRGTATDLYSHRVSAA